MSDNLKTFNETINKFKENELEINAKQDSKLLEIKQEFTNLKEEQKKFITDSETDINKKINQTLSFVWDDIADSKMRIAQERNFVSKELIDDINSLLENKSIALRKEKRSTLIDTLMRCYYYATSEEKRQTDDKVITQI